MNIITTNLIYIKKNNIYKFTPDKNINNPIIDNHININGYSDLLYLIMEINKEIIKILDKIIMNKY